MIGATIEFSRYFIALLFGMVVASGFAGMPPTRKNYLVLGCYTVFIFIIQVLCLIHFGMDVTWKIYPLICHLPIAIFIALYLKGSWLISIISMFAAFLCCQSKKIGLTM